VHSVLTVLVYVQTANFFRLGNCTRIHTGSKLLPVGNPGCSVAVFARLFSFLFEGVGRG
jgi:hypothetical protein